MGRIPQDPAFDSEEKRISGVETQHSGDDECQKNNSDRSLSAVSWPSALNFIKLKSEKTGKEYSAICQQHMEDMAHAGLRLTDADLTPMEFVTRRTKHGISIQAEKARVVGVPFPDLQCVRHTSDFDMDAKTVFDVYVRLNYTKAIDQYTYLVQLLEKIDSVGDRFSWAHVAYTADKIVPFFAHREFVTFDFVDAENLMLVSRSCLHPRRPQTMDPTCLHGILGTFSKRPSRTIRSPLCYFLRIIPLGEKKCRVVQFQYSDIGGIVPPVEQTKAVVKFGLRSMNRFYRLLRRAQAKGLEVGPETKGYLANPLLPKWHKPVAKMIPGL